MAIKIYLSERDLRLEPRKSNQEENSVIIYPDEASETRCRLAASLMKSVFESMLRIITNL